MPRRKPDEKTKFLILLGQNVREQRRRAKLTQEKLAGLAELAPRTIQKIEAGRLDILASTLRRLRAALGCRFDDLLNGD